LGADLLDPVRLVACWTADGSLDGEGLFDDGTGQALRIARHHGIAVLNLARADHLEDLVGP
jgi:LDH2 family malate/lactate/ureidoglycolate dehydrogenase